MCIRDRVKDNLSYMENFTPFAEEEYALVQKAADMINDSIAIPCTGCAYCINKCPKNIVTVSYTHLEQIIVFLLVRIYSVYTTVFVPLL